MPGRRDRDVDRRVGGEPEARLLVGVDDRAARHVRAHGLDQPVRERAQRWRRSRVPVGEPDRDHRSEEQGCGEAGGGLERGSDAPHEPDDEGDGAPDHRDPDHPHRPGVVEDVVEVARIEPLEQGSRDECERRQPRPDEPREHAEPAREREGERKEAGGTPRLRDGDEVGERGEERRDEHEREHRERPAHDERRPPPAGGEHGQRREQQRRDRDRAAAREHLRREAVARLRAHVELAAVLLERAAQLVGVGRHRDRVGRDRDEPEHEERGRDRERAESGQPRTDVLLRPDGAHREEARRTGSRGRSRTSDARPQARTRRPRRRRTSPPSASGSRSAPAPAPPARAAAARTSPEAREPRTRLPCPARSR